MSEVLIVSKTAIGGKVCIGGFDLATRTNIRLLDANGGFQNANSPLGVGEIWTMTYTFPLLVTPPHVEDVHVQAQTLLFAANAIQNLSAYIQSYVLPWNGGLGVTYGGMLMSTHTGSKFISLANYPMCGVGFWISDQDLIYNNATKKYEIHCPLFGVTIIKYVGVATPAQLIPAGTLVRLSLARWWSNVPTMEPRCYLQLSGWY